MNIDWSELGRGISTELSSSTEKTASLMPMLRAGGGMLAKNLPIVGGIAHGVSAVGDAMHGDWTGAALNGGAALADTFGFAPVGIALDAANMVRGFGGGPKESHKEPTLPLGTGLMGGMEGGKPTFNASQSTQSQAQLPPLTINMGARGVNSLGAPPLKLAAIKRANMVDAVENALRNRVINNALDKVMIPSQETPRPAAKDEK
jgi:hypothetical protein